jgi:hypothetical protein
MISGSETLDNTRATPCPKMLPSEATYAYEVSQYGVQLLRVWTSYW